MSQVIHNKIRTDNLEIFLDIDKYQGSGNRVQDIGTINGSGLYKETGGYSINKFLWFNGVDDNLELDSYIINNDEITINALIAPYSVDSEMVICAINNTCLSIKPNGSDVDICWYPSLSESPISYQTSINIKTFSHIAVSHKTDNTVTFFIEGEAAYTTTSTISLDSTTNWKHIGSHNTNYFYGSIHKVLIHSVALNNQDIKIIYNTLKKFKHKGFRIYDPNSDRLRLLLDTSYTDKNATFSLFSPTQYVDWGDGIIDIGGNVISHVYDTSGIYLVESDTPRGGSNFNMANSEGYIKILSFKSNMYLSSYYDCYGLSYLQGPIPQIRPDRTGLTAMFRDCLYSKLEGVENWTVDSVTNFDACFMGCYFFNQDISNWNVSNATNMNNMFRFCRSFNQNLSDWDVSNVISMQNMFDGCYLSTNANFTGWDTSNVVDMATMFQNAVGLNGEVPGLSDFDTSSVTNMSRMFSGASQGFDTNIGSWNVTNVTDMNGMFIVAYWFNQDLSQWDTSNVTSMREMFWQTGFYRSNLYLGIGSWNVSSVETMYRMFFNNRYFNEDLSSWNLAGLSSSDALTLFMWGVGLSNENYDALLNGWNNNKLAVDNGIADWRTDLSPHFGNSKYTSAGSSARQQLIDYGWTITDGGLQT